MTHLLPRSALILGLALSLSACAPYQPSEAECFTSFTETDQSGCDFDLLQPGNTEAARDG